ncbi:MAG: phosphoribosylformylglycinamidine synthase subunit PurL [Armatimonadetes bacterium]|nr:phosphoribosylformylglycinamidine synthase subunit PurL [Armatimonadota bacterium]
MATITKEVYSSMGLTESEYGLIVQLIGRTPSLTELGMFAVMWSEHCGYKYSRPVLKLFKKYKAAMEGSGLENAGIVDIGDGLGVTFKVESHNHPSAVEPYEGAATGVGGIIRDILTMGARPIASLNSLRFGPIRNGEAEEPVVMRNRYLFERVVAGIGGYGNCVGVPTVAGEVAFHPRYSGNPLVNAMCVGILKLDEITTAAASGAGNPVIYLGSSTGKDGIHGATFASEALGEDNEEKRPNVQIGDPFAEKSLIEATLEALQTGAVVAIQDMGAAGLTCSTVEMAAKGAVGMDVSLDLVPVREAGMTSSELMLSESQERMLAVAKKGREQEVLDAFHKWGLNAVVIGHVTEEPILRVRYQGETVAELDPRLLADTCPTYSTGPEEPAYYRRALLFDPKSLAAAEPNAALLKLLASPNLSSKRWVFRQYDQSVQTQTSLLPGQGDAAVLAPRGTHKGISVKIDGNGRQVYLDPYVGGMLAVCEAARNVACTGAIPVAATDGLNFGNPQRPHVFWQFKRAVEGLAEACDALDTPVVSGNVSFYNESDLGEVPPTPLVGMLGVMPDVEKRIGMAPKSGGGHLYLLATSRNPVRQGGLGASEYAAEVCGVEDGVPCAPDLAAEKALCRVLSRWAMEGRIECAHDLSEGGLAVAAAEIALAGSTGLEISIATGGSGHFAGQPGVASALFGEVPGRVLVGVAAGSPSPLDGLSPDERELLTVVAVGEFGGVGLKISVDGGGCVDLSLEDMKEAFEGTLPALMAH